jgi:hypothetical protein
MLFEKYNIKICFKGMFLVYKGSDRKGGTSIGLYIYIYIYMCVCVCVCVYIHTYKCLYAYMYITCVDNCTYEE